MQHRPMCRLLARAAAPLAAVLLAVSGCKTALPAQSRVAEDQVAAGGPVYRVWLAYRHRDQAGDVLYGDGNGFAGELTAHLANVAKLRSAYPSLRSYVLAVSPQAAVSDHALRRKVPDAIALAAYSSADAYKQDREKNGNALNAAHWQLFEIGKTHQLVAAPASGQVQPYQAYTLLDNGAQWRTGTTSYVFAQVNGNLAAAVQRLQTAAAGMDGLKGLVVATGSDYVACLFDWGTADANAAAANGAYWDTALGQLKDVLTVTASAASAHPAQAGVQVGAQADLISLNDAAEGAAP